MPRKIAVIGAGVMGLDIAFEYVAAGFEVLIFDKFGSNPAFQKDKQDKMWRLLFLALKNRKLVYPTDEAIEAASQRITWLDSTPDNFRRLAECEAVIEAIFEDIAVKHKLIREIESVCDAPVSFLSNTSTLMVRLLAEASKWPERIMGFHFFNPVRMMKLIEGIPHDRTAEDVIEKAKELALAIGKKFELVPDLPGFLVNRLLLPMIERAGNLLDAGADYRKIDEVFKSGAWGENFEALQIINSHIAAAHSFLREQEKSRIKLSREKIDEIVRLGTNFPAGPFGLDEAIQKGETKRLRFFMGPVELCDLVGIDVAEHCLRMLRLQESDRWGEAPTVLKRLSAEKKLGKKTGEGFYSSVEVSKVKMANGQDYARVVLRENTVSHSTIKRIKSVFDSLRQENIEAVVFEITKCRGADVSEFPLAARNPELAKKVIGDWHAAIKSIIGFPKPVIAVVRGVAWGGGYELAQACDDILAVKGTRLGQPEVQLGIMPGGGGTQNLTRRVGFTNAFSMILDPQTEVEAEKPWVDEVLEEITSENLEKFIQGSWKRNRFPIRINGSVAEAAYLISNLKRKFVKNAPAAFAAAVVAILAGNQEYLIESGLDLEAGLVIKLFEQSAQDIKEGIRARFENREPNFTGE
ncbi:MAG: hypothetical protein A2750_01385 [Candidatus Yanofskybacteria bacterium RIFCSPHIGHO2_01_FULL_45_42]|uniref:enoyl-CoA hydratase n=2 Tax=Parcubacteria group TaxID=1794811 RepID=A0A1G1ZS71_9BACT|nr:MAG: hypothetical protein A2750_01385 [Candidatus Yanofskybacteria bacterium RIFCSPHIGHO2_01_FULL_45_42]OGY63888.1 MAG: hypothetical protein A3J53_03645 [Candidatus Harrisonbacteria bacterium RIFCSPHIGHO2_02_FULL_40_20]OGY66966.1 MAG: hypothetical protein A3I24_00615 [Candidatus Harrisonbacteria bacterium RIFCSPLOWO2_02_FULL_41_13b]